MTMHRSYRQAQLSYYTFKYDRKKGRRQLGVRPTEMAHLLPEALSTFTLPVVLPNGSRSSVEGVPNVDWTYLFAHTVTVTQARQLFLFFFLFYPIYNCRTPYDLRPTSLTPSHS